MGSPRLIRDFSQKNGKRTVLADRYEGKRLNCPNDVVVKRDGAIYFTETWVRGNQKQGTESSGRPRLRHVTLAARAHACQKQEVETAGGLLSIGEESRSTATRPLRGFVPTIRAVRYPSG